MYGTGNGLDSYSRSQITAPSAKLAFHHMPLHFLLDRKMCVHDSRSTEAQLDYLAMIRKD